MGTGTGGEDAEGKERVASGDEGRERRWRQEREKRVRREITISAFLRSFSLLHILVWHRVADHKHV